MPETNLETFETPSDQVLCPPEDTVLRESNDWQIRDSATNEYSIFDDAYCAFVELIRTFIFLFLGLATAQAALYFNTDKMSPATLLTIATGFGLGLMIAITMTIKISGGHLNPAGTMFIN
jgi:hypothetical protein